VERQFMELAEKPKRRAVVIGGSIAGLFVGAFLRRIGWQVDIYERSSTEPDRSGRRNLC
jgi:2-polyprenyl-6-methoxyphenol hydroxylase-like FAD-dependent oxidoreductase